MINIRIRIGEQSDLFEGLNVWCVVKICLSNVQFDMCIILQEKLTDLNMIWLTNEYF